MIFHEYINCRAKQRKDIRYEETRGDWYFERKHQKQVENCVNGKCSKKEKGEKFHDSSRQRWKKEDGDFKRGEQKKFHEEVRYKDRHYERNNKRNHQRYYDEL